MLLETIGSVWSGHGSSGPRALFLNSEPGFYLDFATTQPLYQDTAAATPLTLPDQSVGLAADRSRARSPITVAAAVQASTGLRPKWGRMPKGGRRNQSTYTSQFANAAWLKFDASYASGKFTEGTGASIHRLNQADTIVAGQNYVFWAEVQAAERTRVMLRTNNGSVDADTVFDLSNGTIVSGTGGVVALAGGWYRVWRTFTAAASTTSNFIKQMLLVNTGSNTSYTGDGTSGVMLRFAQFEVGTTPTAGQEVTNAADVTEAGLPSYGYIRPDLMDDFLTVTTPAAQTGDVMLFGRKGTWLETGVTYGSGAAVAIGPTTMTGLPAGLLQAVQGPVSDIAGGLVGVLAIGRTLTATERTAALNYYKARGAAGLLVAGAELVTNGDNEAGVAVAPVDGLTNFTAKVQSADRAQSGAYSAKLTANATSGSHYWVLKNIGAAEAIQVSGWAFVPTGATAGQSLKLVDIFDGSFVPEIVPNAGKYDQWVYFKAVRPAKGTAWTLSLGQDTAANWAGGSIYIDGLSIKNLTVTP